MIAMSLAEAAAAVQGRLLGKDRTFTGCNIDSRAVKPGELFIALRGAARDGHDFVDAARERGAAAALVERDAAYGLPVIQVDDARQQAGALAGHWRAKFDLPVIAVTGSNGKTTVKEMLRSILAENAPVLSTQGNYNNDIGAPLTLFNLGREHRFAVVEMGANHAGEILWLSRIAKPTVGLITLCAPAHLEGFGSIEGVARAKAEIYQGLLPGGTAVINSDDDYADLWRECARDHRQLTFGMKEGAAVTAANVVMDFARGGAGFELAHAGERVKATLALPGRHNVMNALAAAAGCIAVGVSLEQTAAGLEKMRPVKGRLQPRRGLRGMRILDDAYNANPVSLQAALEAATAAPGEAWLALGDMGELGAGAAGFHEEAGRRARDLGVARLYALGELAAAAVEQFGAGARHFRRAEDLADALRREARPGVTLLVKGSRFMAMERVANALAEEDG